MSKLDRKFKNVECIKINYEADEIGHGVDKTTGEGTPAEYKIDEEKLIMSLVISGEIGEYDLPEPYKSGIYELVWKYLNDIDQG